MIQFPKTALTVASILASSAINAETIEIVCGAQNIVVITDPASLKVDGVSEPISEWSYDGAWLRVTRKSGELLGFNAENGYIIQNQKSQDAGCKFLDVTALASLPLSDGAWLRRAFVLLAPDDRKRVQRALQDGGVYTGTLDGRWGQGTEAAIFQIVGSQGISGDPKSEIGSREIVTSLLANAVASEGEGADEDEDYVEAVATNENVRPAGSFAGCGAKPFNEQKFLQENIRKFDAFGYLMAIEDAGAQLDVADRSRAENVLQAAIRDYQHPNAAALLGGLRYEQGQYAEAYRYLQIAAEGGDASSSYVMGLAFGGLDKMLSSIGPRNIDASHQCLNFAVSQGELSAIVLLSGAYAHATEIPKEFYDKLPLNYDKSLDLADQYFQLASSDDQQMADMIKLKAETEVKSKVKKQELATAEMSKAKQIADTLKAKCTDSTTVLGLCWAMTPEEMHTTLVSRGFSRIGSTDSYPASFGRTDQSEISIATDSISFSCRVFDACRMGVDKVFTELVQSKALTDVEDKHEYREIPGVGSILEQGLCGYAINGEQLCAITTSGSGLFALGGEGVEIHFGRGSHGKKGISFD